MCRYTKAPETQTALVLNSGGKGKANFSLLPSTYYVRVLVLPARLTSDSRHYFFEEGNRFLLIHSSVVGGSHRVRIRTPIIAEYAPYIIDFQLCTYLWLARMAASDDDSPDGMKFSVTKPISIRLFLIL